MEFVANTLYTTSEHGVSCITVADAHTSAATSRLNWRPPPIEMNSSVSPKDEIWFLHVCHHISNVFYLRLGPVEMWWHTVTHGRGSEGETGEWSGYPVLFTLPRNMVYPALLPLMRTPRLPVVDW